jgi:hypothetical protein
MKKLLFLTGLVAILALTTLPLQGAAGNSRKQMARVTFTVPVTVQGQVLKGDYLFVHDDAAMERGEACTYIYKGDSPLANKLVLSFHCTPGQREKASHFVTRTVETVPGVVELREFQFGGDTETHVIPTK